MTSPTPLLKPWYRLASRNDSLVFAYGESVVVFEGRAAQTLLPALLPRLDGRRTLDEIAAELGPAARPAIESAVALLDRHGLLTEPPASSGTAQLLAALAGGAPAEAAGRLAASAVGVAGASEAGAEVARLLRLSGVERVQRLESWEEVGTLDLAIVAPSPAELPLLRAWNERALARGTAWLQLLPYDGHGAAVGPLYVPGETSCYACYLLRRRANVGYAEELEALEQAPAAYPSAPPLELAAAGLAALVALRWLAFADPFVPGVVWTLELTSGPWLARHEVFRVPRCSACSGLGDTAPPAPWFEESAR